MTIADKIKYVQNINPKPIELTLERITIVAEKLQLLHFDCPVITVGGTNGKGSTVATLESIYHALGYKTAVFTSPQIISHTELIRLNQKNITDQQLSATLDIIEASRGEILLTEFEFMTLAALWLFKQMAPDIIILEVGVGGRDDAVNIVSADLAVITNIALDHCQWLGNDRHHIAKIKAGIMRKNKTLIIGETHPPTILFNYAQELSVNVQQLGKDFSYQTHNSTWTWRNNTYRLENLPLPNFIVENIATAIMAIRMLFPELSAKKLTGILKNILPKLSLPGRWQIKNKPCLQIFDVAHNPAAAIQLARKLTTLQITGKVHAIFSMFSDKDIANTIKPLQPHIDSWHIATLSHSRAATLQQLQQALQTNHIEAIKEYQTIDTAYQAVLKQVKQPDLILVFGSFQVLNAVGATQS